MGHVQDPPVSTKIISIVCMIYHMKVHTFRPQKNVKIQNSYFDHFRTNFNETSYSDIEEGMYQF